MMKQNPEVPEWVIKQPQTPLEIQLYGKLYEHHLICSGDRGKPVGSPGCCCLGFLSMRKIL